MLIGVVGSSTFVAVALLASLLVVLTVALCLCKQRSQKPTGCAISDHLQPNSDSLVKSQPAESQQNGTVCSSSPLEKVCLHPRPVTERALPTPPGRPQSLPASLPAVNSNAVPAATPDSRSSTLARPHRKNKAPAPPPPVQTATPSGSAGPVEELRAGGDTPSESSESDPLYSVATARPLCHSETLDTAPPVPEKRFETPMETNSSEATFRATLNSGESDASTSATPVGAAAPDVSFATAPLVDPLGEIANTSGASDLSYTVLSVREPLAKVREETMRQRRAQNAATQEAYYTEVPEEEQMYAEIESGHNSAGSSVTYAMIEPRGPDPPAPPTVESLKSVAQAHSRQASTSSFTGGTSPDGDASSLYTTVDKNSKQRQTIHVSEGLSAEGVSLNDLYAKVHKTGRCSKSQEEQLKPTKTDDDASHRPHSLPPGAEPSLHLEDAPAHPHPLHESASLLEPLPPPPVEYADPAYERVYHQDSSDTDPCYERLGDGRADLSDPDYERVGNSEPGYETIRRDASITFDEPGYEKIRRVNGICADPARVNDGDDTDYIAEHGYEKIKGANDVTYDETSDPGYERIKRKEDRSYDEVSDPGYERIRKMQDDESVRVDSDPGYERIRDLSKRTGSSEKRHAKKQERSPPTCKTTRHSGGSSDETYGRVSGSKLKPRDLGYHLMKDAPSSGDSQSASWKGASDSSSSLDRADATEDSSSEEPGYDRVKHPCEKTAPAPEAPPRGRLSLRTRGWPSSDSNLTSTCQEQADWCSLSASASAVVQDPESSNMAPCHITAHVHDSEGVALYEVVADVRMDDDPVMWTRNSSRRSSDHREYIF